MGKIDQIKTFLVSREISSEIVDEDLIIQRVVEMPEAHHLIQDLKQVNLGPVRIKVYIKEGGEGYTKLSLYKRFSYDGFHNGGRVITFI